MESIYKETNLFRSTVPSAQQAAARLAAKPTIIAEVAIASYPGLYVYPARDTNKILKLMLTLVREKLKSY